MGCFGQKVAFFRLLDINKGYPLSGQPSFLRVFGLVVGGRNLLVLFSFIVHKAGLQPTGDDVSPSTFRHLMSPKWFVSLILGTNNLLTTGIILKISGFI